MLATCCRTHDRTIHDVFLQSVGSGGSGGSYYLLLRALCLSVSLAVERNQLGWYYEYRKVRFDSKKRFVLMAKRLIDIVCYSSI